MRPYYRGKFYWQVGTHLECVRIKRGFIPHRHVRMGRTHEPCVPTVPMFSRMANEYRNNKIASMCNQLFICTLRKCYIEAMIFYWQLLLLYNNAYFSRRNINWLIGTRFLPDTNILKSLFFCSNLLLIFALRKNTQCTA